MNMLPGQQFCQLKTLQYSASSSSSPFPSSFTSTSSFQHDDDGYSELTDDSPDLSTHVVSPLPINYIDPSILPKSFSWDALNPRTFLKIMVALPMAFSIWVGSFTATSTS